MRETVGVRQVRDTHGRIAKSALILALGLGFSIPAWGSACSASYAALTSAGCTAGSDVFSNFVVTTLPSAPASINGVLTPDLTLSPLQVAGPTLAQLEIERSPVNPNGIAIDTAVDIAGTPVCKSNSGNVAGAWCIEGHGANEYMMSVITYNRFNPNGITSDLVQLALTTHANTTVAGMFEEICVGVANLAGGSGQTWAGAGGTCAGAGGTYHVLQLGEIAGQFQQGTMETAGVTFSSVTNISIRDTIFLQTFGGTGAFATVTGFAEAPEPATLGMVGLSLLGLGGLHFRRKKRT